MTSKVRVAVLGVGSLGKEHARIYSELAAAVQVEFVGVYDISAESARKFAQKYQVRAFTSIAEAAEAADALKGWVAVQIGTVVVAKCLPGAPPEYLRITAGIAAILGHNFTCWLHFKGGKGIATSAGVLIALVPLALAIILSIFIILFVTTRYVSVGSIAAAFALPFATWFTQHDIGLTAVMTAIGALAILKHRKNIQRLLNGTENRIQFKKKEATS